MNVSSAENTRVWEKFRELYPQCRPEVSFCPYRVCPLGAHIDHQYGKVLGMAINEGITVVYAPAAKGLIEVSSLNYPGKQRFEADRVPPVKQGDWADYLRGATRILAREHRIQNGLFAVIDGSLPTGGLSSSAAVVIAFVAALCRVNDIHLTPEQIRDISIESENMYVGVSCGKLDQSCELYSKENHLLYLDTRDDSYELIQAAPRMKPWKVAVLFSGVQRTLVGSRYNMRLDEMKSAAYCLKAFSGMEYGKYADTRMRDVPWEVFEEYKDRLPENFKKRAEHYYAEFARAEKGAGLWRAGDLDGFGKLVFESGYSSIYLYETGSEELKTLYEIMLDTEGIYGGRFSGAGFRGCCMGLANPAFTDSIRETVTERYLKKFPELSDTFRIYFCDSADGVKL